MKRALLTCVLLCSTQAKAACHHFTRWYYPYPQSCAVKRSFTAQAEDKSWYVEFVPPEWLKPPVYLTPEQLEDSIEHNMAVMRKKDEINELWNNHQ